MTNIRSPVDQKRQLWFTRLSTLEGFFFAITVASSEAYGLYYYAKNDTSPLRVGLLATMPLLFSAIGQLTIPKRVRHEQLRATITALILVQIIGLALIWSCAYELSFWKLLIGSSLYWIGGQNASPLWMDWSNEHVEANRFPAFLANRNMIVTIVGIGMFAGASFWLDNLDAFKWLFLGGLIARLLSLAVQLILFRQFGHDSDSAKPKHHHEKEAAPPPVRDSEMMMIVKRILVPLTIFRFGVNIASPFFLPYMTHELKLNTQTYALLSAMPLVARLFFLSNWARSGTGWRPFWGVQVCSLGISILPGLWALWNDVPYLAIYQILSGIFWSGMELCATLMVQNLARGQARIIQGRMLAMNTAFTLLGTFVGGILLEQKFSYEFVFTLSTVLRICSSIWLYLTIARYPRLALNKKTIAPYLATVMSIRPTLANTAKIFLGPRRRRRT